MKDCADGTRSGRVGSGNKDSAMDDGAAVARRFCLSKPHMEHLVASSRCLLAEEAVRGGGWNTKYIACSCPPPKLNSSLIHVAIIFVPAFLG